VPANNYPERRPATGSHFYKYSTLEYPERLMRIVLEHEIYVPTVAQLNDPADARPLLAPMSDEQLVNFLLVKNFDPNSSLARATKADRLGGERNSTAWR
jgi:hypothetical protein